MSGWRKGPRCNVSNCPSRLWRLVDGRDVCKNGHVSSTVELVNDDDDLRGHKRIKRVNKQVHRPESEKAIVLVGVERDRATASICGALLREQVRSLRRKYHLSSDFERVVRSLFAKIVSASSLGPRNRVNTSPPLALDIPDSVVILRLALAEIGAPLSYIDLKRLIDTGELPYNCLYAVPALFETLAKAKGVAANYYTTPSLRFCQERARLMAKLLSLSTMTSSSPKLIFQPLVYKLVRDLMLPPVVYTFAMNILQHETPSIFFIDQTAVAAVVFATKALYQISEPDTEIQECSRDNPDWEVWSDMMEKVWVDTRVEDWDEKDALYWDDDAVDTVLRKYEEIYPRDMPGDSKEENSNSRINNLFSSTDHSVGEADVYDYSVHRELMQALYQLNNGGTAKNQEPIFTPPSDQYAIYSKHYICQWVLPPVVETLYRVCSQFLGLSETMFRKYQYAMEHRFKPLYQDTREGK